MPERAPAPARRGRRAVAAVVALALLAGTGWVLGPSPHAGAVPGQVPTTRPAPPGPGRTSPPPTATLPRPEPSTGDANGEADRILADPAYDESPSVVERVLRWIGEKLDELFGDQEIDPSLPASAPPGDGGVLAWIILGLLLAVVVFFVLRWWGTPVARRRKPAGDPLSLAESQVRRAPDAWLAEAERLERSGQWKAALRSRFRALVGELIERGVVGDEPGRTSGEYRAEVRRRAREASGPFTQASRLFDAAWYGDRPTGPDEAAAFRRSAEEALAAVPAGPRRRDDREAVGAGADGGGGAS